MYPRMQGRRSGRWELKTVTVVPPGEEEVEAGGDLLHLVLHPLLAAGGRHRRRRASDLRSVPPAACDHGDPERGVRRPELPRPTAGWRSTPTSK
jgi:hypothetical protein